MPIVKLDSMDEMSRFLQIQEDVANNLTKDWQKRVSYGDHFVVYEKSVNLFVFCYVISLEVLFPPLSPTASRNAKDERHFELELHNDNYQRGYRMCMNYSTMNREGEWGNCHVLKVLTIISKERFDRARMYGWDTKEFFAQQPLFAKNIEVALKTYPYLQGPY